MHDSEKFSTKKFLALYIITFLCNLALIFAIGVRGWHDVKFGFLLSLGFGIFGPVGTWAHRRSDRADIILLISFVFIVGGILATINDAAYGDWRSLILPVLPAITVTLSTGFWRNWFPWIGFIPAKKWEIILDTAIAVLTLTMFFSAITAELVAHHQVRTKPEMKSFLLIRSGEHYSWELLEPFQ